MLRPRQVLALFPLLLIGFAARADVTEEFQRTLPLTADGSLSVSNVNGAIDITSWDRNEVEIRATKRADDREELAEIQIEIEAEEGSISVETELPEGRNRGGSVEYHIQAPQGASIHTEAVNGRVRIAGSRGGVHAETVNGAIELEEVAGALHVETVNGSANVVYAETPAEGEHSFESVNGAIRVAFPSSVAGEFEAETVNGSIETDFPLQVTKARFGPSSSLQGRVGTGGGQFRFETVNGSIRILNREKTASTVRYHLDRKP